MNVSKQVLRNNQTWNYLDSENIYKSIVYLQIYVYEHGLKFKQKALYRLVQIKPYYSSSWVGGGLKQQEVPSRLHVGLRWSW